jgi:hypothetical protein
MVPVLRVVIFSLYAQLSVRLDVMLACARSPDRAIEF